jgi:hypothetical protein
MSQHEDPVVLTLTHRFRITFLCMACPRHRSPVSNDAEAIGILHTNASFFGFWRTFDPSRPTRFGPLIDFMAQKGLRFLGEFPPAPGVRICRKD